MRLRALLAVLLAVLAPLIWVWFSGVADQGVAATLRWEDRQAAANAQQIVRRGEGDVESQLAAIASRYGVWLRVLDADGVVVYDLNRVVRWRFTLLDPFYGPEGRPEIRRWDAQQLPLGQRPEVREARSFGRVSRCTVVASRRLLVCGEVRTLSQPDGDWVIHVQKPSRRVIRGLWDVRWPLTALTLIMLTLGLAVGLWLGGRVVQPILTLRRQILDRTAPPLSTEPVSVDKDDEFADLAQAFNALLAALDARNVANVAFAADLAHELKNPVAAIRTASEALDRVEGERVARVQRILADSTRRLDQMVTRFLDLARAEAGLAGQSRQPVPLDALLEGLLGGLRAQHPALEWELEAESVRIEAVPERLETALRNLLINAAAFAAQRVRVRLVRDQDVALISIADDGPGLAEDDLERIFDRYHSTRAGGTGLGLPLARAIAEAHGGSLSAHCDGGAVFCLRLPLAPAGAPPAPSDTGSAREAP